MLKLLSATVASATASEMQLDPDYPTFVKFMGDFNRRYNSAAETEGRFRIFKDNLRLIEQRNARGAEKHGINKFVDIHPEEFKRQYLGLKPVKVDQSKLKYFNSTQLKATSTAAPINWATNGATTPIKNQGQCGSCWAFSATEQLESAVYLKSGNLNVLSEQQIVSCDTNGNDQGCNGGNPIGAWAYVAGAGGQEFNSYYSYTSGVTQADGSCKFNSAHLAPDTTPQTYSLIASQASQENNMIAQIQESPMSICVDAAQLWQTYVSGIVTKASNCGINIDHAVQVVGLEVSSTGVHYWVVRNSWGVDWGNDGYIYVEAGQNNCGITHQATIVNI